MALPSSEMNGMSALRLQARRNRRAEAGLRSIVLGDRLQPHTSPADSTHPTGYMRDGYCWGSGHDAGKHYIGGVVTTEFLEYSKGLGEFETASEASRDSHRRSKLHL